jgi:hypothetical protein
MTLPNYPDPTGNPADPGLPTPEGIRPGAPEPQAAWMPAQPAAWTPPPGYPPYPGYVYAPARPTNGMAIASMVVSIASLLVCAGLPGIVGALLGHSARRQIRERGEEGDGMALAGVIVGWIGFGLGIAVVIVYAIIFSAMFATMQEQQSSYSSDYSWIFLGY